MGSRLLSRLIIILQFRTEFHHLPQTQLIPVVRATYQNVEPQPRPAQDRWPTAPLCPPLHTIPGPAQLEVCRLKVVKPNEAAVRQALHHLGYSRTRVSQLWAECQQNPPRSWLQRQRQTAQDHMNGIPSGNDCHIAMEAMAHRTSWFTELKDGDVPVGKLLVYQSYGHLLVITGYFSGIIRVISMGFS